MTQYICKAAVGKASSGDKDADADDAKLAEEMYKAFVQTVARWVVLMTHTHT